MQGDSPTFAVKSGELKTGQRTRSWGVEADLDAKIKDKCSPRKSCGDDMINFFIGLTVTLRSLIR